MKHFLLFLFFATASTLPALADQVTLKNGDRLSGTIIKSDAKQLVIKSEFAGTVTVVWDAITAITSTNPIYVGLKDGQTIVGPVETSGANLTIKTATTGTVTAAKDSVVSIRDKDEETAYEKEIDRLRNPRIIDLWAGTLDFGFAGAAGNSETQSLTLTANANRATTRDKITVSYASLFATTNVTGKSTTTANSKRGGIGYNLNVDSRYFVFGSVGLESDEFQSLDLRFVPAGGFGYHAIKNETTQLDLSVGGSLNDEYFSTGLHRTSGEVLLGEELTHKFSANSSIHEMLVFFPNLTDTGQYRINFDTTWATAIRKWFSWQVAVSDRYLSNPVPGRKTNDIIYSTGIRMVFAK